MVVAALLWRSLSSSSMPYLVRNVVAAPGVQREFASAFVGPALSACACVLDGIEDMEMKEEDEDGDGYGEGYEGEAAALVVVGPKEEEVEEGDSEHMSRYCQACFQPKGLSSGSRPRKKECAHRLRSP